MYRQVLIPDNRRLVLQLPADLIGKTVEVLAFPIEELKEEKVIVTTKRKPSDYAGCITEKTAKAMLKNISESRKEWERNI